MVPSCPWEEALAAASLEVLWLMGKQVLSPMSVTTLALMGMPVQKAPRSFARDTAMAVGTAPTETISAEQWPCCPTTQQRFLTMSPGMVLEVVRHFVRTV